MHLILLRLLSALLPVHCLQLWSCWRSSPGTWAPTRRCCRRCSVGPCSWTARPATTDTWTHWPRSPPLLTGRVCCWPVTVLTVSREIGNRRRGPLGNRKGRGVMDAECNLLLVFRSFCNVEARMGPCHFFSQ